MNRILDYVLFPNPAQESAYININLETLISIDCYDITGKKLKLLFGQKEKVLEIDLRKLQKGIYFVQIQTDKKTTCQKLIIE